MTPAQRKVAALMSERDTQDQIVKIAHAFGWRAAHFRPSRRGDGTWRTPVAYDGAGFPDLVLAHRTGRVLFVEVKAQTGRVEPAQQQWLDTLQTAGSRHHLPTLRVHVWRPSDLLDGTVVRELGAAQPVGSANLGSYERACRECGCTDAVACEGGCSWAGPDLCSRCATVTTS